jgi:NAD(P)H dehydrogenase (quinone)
VQVHDLTETQYTVALTKTGLPEGFARILADSDAHAADGWLFDDSRTLENVIGRPTTPLDQSLDAALDVR